MLMNKFTFFKRDVFYRILVLLSLVSILVYNYRSTRAPDVRGTLITTPYTREIKTSTDLTVSPEPEVNLTSLYYRHVSGQRNSSYPFISGDTYRSIADYVFDELKQDELSSVKFGDIVFLKGDMLPKFFGNPYASINQSFVLVSHNSDCYVPEVHDKHLKEKKIIVWYASNPDTRNHTKLIPIPIGLSNRQWPGGNLTAIEYAFKHHRRPWSNRTTLLYVNFALKTNPGERSEAMGQARKVTNAQIIDKKISFQTYLEQVGNAKFVLSPPGYGLDCHRTWEALLLGAVPVVRSSTLDPLFANTSAVIVKAWSELNDTLLASYKPLTDVPTLPSVLSGRYWRERLLKHRLMQ